jgi:N-acetylneuraminic acid mutarotase
MSKHSKCVAVVLMLLVASVALAAGPASLSAPADQPSYLRNSDCGVADGTGNPPPGEQDVLVWVNKAAIPEGVSRTAGVWDAAGLFHLVGGNCQTHTSHPQDQIYDPGANSWSAGLTHPAGTYGVHNHDCAIIGNVIYVGGGSQASAYYNDLTAIDLDAGTWDVLTPMPVASLLYYKFAVAGGKLYLFGGGVAGTTIQNICYEFDPGTGSWTQKANMPAVRRDVMTATVGDTIYIMGGYDGTTAYNTVWKYSVTGDNYTVGTALPEARWWGRAVTYIDPSMGPILYVMGGINAGGAILNTVITYTVNTGVWGTETPLLLTLRSHAANISSTGNLFVAGGYSGAIQTACEMATITPASGSDVGLSAIRVPGTQVAPGTPLAPRGVVRNYGTSPQSNIPVFCRIDSSGTPVYNQNLTITGPVAPGETATALFATTWTPGYGLVYSVKMYTDLPGDSARVNDTARVTATTWVNIAAPADSADRIVHGTVYDPIGDKIYMIGGNPAGASATYLALNQAYDPIANTWSNKAPMPTARGWLSCAYARGKIYAIGGHTNAGAPSALNEAYDIAGNAWSTVAPRPSALLAALIGVWRDSLVYVMGGWDGTSGSGSTTVDIYDPFSNAWLTGTALPQEGDMGGATIVGDTIFITNAVQRSASACWLRLYKGYIDPSDPTNITWIQGPTHSPATSITGATSVNGRVFWLGGFIGLSTPSDRIWVYDPATGAITSFPVNYLITLGRNDNIVGRSSANELYVIAGDSGCNWAAPNRKYAKIVVPVNITGVSEERRTTALTVSTSVRPNPANGTALVSYTLSTAANVNLKLYDASGKLVRTLVNGFRPAGTASLTFDRSTLAKGIYLLKLAIPGSTATAKLVIE